MHTDGNIQEVKKNLLGFQNKSYWLIIVVLLRTNKTVILRCPYKQIFRNKNVLL
jgi:hypothetical protein